MADQKISQLSDGTTPQDTDQIPIARAGSNFSLTWAELKAAITTGVSSVFGRTGAVTAQSGDYTAAQVTNAADKSSGSQQAFTGEISAPDFTAGGLTGATSASRYVGATASGAPGSGTFVVGDFVIARNGHLFICTTAGSPGTWTDAGSVGNLVSSVFGRTGAVTAQSGDYTAAQVTNAADKSSGSQQAFTAEVASPDFAPSGLTGATSASRYVGATTSGSPGSGTFATGDFVVARNGHIFVCSSGGSPGTWVDVGSVSNAVTSVFGRTGAVTATSGDYNLNQIGNATGDYSINTHKLTSVKDPTAAQDAATKAYVDSVTPGNGGGKGHLSTATAANTPSDLAPGTDGTMLTADSTQANGLTYANTAVVNVYGAGSNSWSKPAGCTTVEVICIGAGGGGGGGGLNTGASAGSGGGGGGGGAVSRAVFQASDVGSSVTVTVGTGGTGGGSAANGNGGSAATTFGTLLMAGAGGGGRAGATAAASGGGGGGSPVNSGSGSNGGSPAVTSPTTGIGGQSTTSAANVAGACTEWGGAAGGGGAAGNNAGQVGGSSMFAGPGGGCGGGSSTSTPNAGGAGGTTQSYTSGGGAGGSAGSANPLAGSNGTSFIGPYCGSGGGGGGATTSTSVVSGVGGNGGIGAGGGGGGSGRTTAPGGGNGGDGRCIVIAHR